MNLQVGELGPSRHVKRPDFIVVRRGEDLQAIARPRNRSGRRESGCDGPDIDQLVAVATLENADVIPQAGSGDMLATWGELDTSDSVVVLQRANKFLPVWMLQIIASKR